MTAMDKYLRTKGYTPLIINTEGDLNFEVRSIGSLAWMRVDGIILVASYITPAHRKAVEHVQVPWCLWDKSSAPAFQCWTITWRPARSWAAMWRSTGCARWGFCG